MGVLRHQEIITFEATSSWDITIQEEMTAAHHLNFTVRQFPVPVLSLTPPSPLPD